MEENLYMPGCIRTFTGQYVNILDPKPETICIEDIAHSLSFIPRFNGHLPELYSVAQHSVMCAMQFDKKEHIKVIQALMHDSTEAYVHDISRPVKVELSNYKEIENRFAEVIFNKFNIPYPLGEEIKSVDNLMLQFEWNACMLNQSKGFKIYWGQKESKRKFLEIFKEFYNKI